MAERGKFIVLYGANNLGKSTQVELLVNNLRTLQHWKLTHKVKYPIYDLDPGLMIF
jgi:thymidylate kinase